MPWYRVVINNMTATYTERWHAESPHDAEDRARRRWQREFKDAGAFNFRAREIKPTRWSDEDDPAA